MLTVAGLRELLVEYPSDMEVVVNGGGPGYYPAVGCEVRKVNRVFGEGEAKHREVLYVYGEVG